MKIKFHHHHQQQIDSYSVYRLPLDLHIFILGVVTMVGGNSKL